MRDLLLSVSALACPVAMGLMMWFMGKGMRGARAPDCPPADASLGEVRAEHRRLGAELERTDPARPPT